VPIIIIELAWKRTEVKMAAAPAACGEDWEVPDIFAKDLSLFECRETKS
jgi:hypothetical protein